MNTLTIGKLASASNIGIETIRFYERRGLLPAPPRSAAGYRRYPESIVQRLQFIHRAKALGFSLDEIATLLALHENTRDHSRGEVKAVANSKLTQIDQKIRDLERMRTALAKLVAACSGHGSLHGCPIIEALVGEEENESVARTNPKAASL